MASTDPFPSKHSKDGRIRVDFDPQEVRMSIWILAPTVVRVRDDHVVAQLPHPWDGSACSFPRRDHVVLRLRRYPANPKAIAVTIDVEAEQFWYPDGTGEEPRFPVAELESRLEDHHVAEVEESADDYLRQGACPYCRNATTFVPSGVMGWLRLSRRVRCIVCEREFTLPPGAPR